MYELARGPLMWAATIIFFTGIIYRCVQLYLLTGKKERAFFYAAPVKPRERTPEERKMDMIVAVRNSLLGTHPIMAIVSFVFHSFICIIPLFLLGHNLLIYESWGISLFSLPDGLCDALAAVFVLIGLFFLLRRMIVPQVRIISTYYDYLVLAITVAPFLTGFFAYHQWFDYKTVITIHMLVGELMLIAIPFTKIGHMIFFFFVRILISSEHSFWRGNRAWQGRA
jgi:nitrate reductase gamma subunit